MYPNGKHINFAEIIKVLKEINYEGFINLECINVPNGYEAALHGYRYIKTLLDK